MNNFDLIGALRTFSSAKGWAFLSGDNFFQNYEASKNDYTPGQLILGVDPPLATPKITQAGKIESITYQGLLMLGRKFESDLETPASVTTISNLDETFIQKYDRRLYELMNTLSTNLIAFSCSHELDILASQFELKLNTLDENVDFVVCSITLKQG